MGVRVGGGGFLKLIFDYLIFLKPLVALSHTNIFVSCLVSYQYFCYCISKTLSVLVRYLVVLSLMNISPDI